MGDDMYDTIIIGAGVAGLTASLYLRRANKNILVLEGKSYGGQIINSSEVANYPGISKITGFDFATNLYNQVKDLDTDIKYERVLKIEDGKLKKVITNENIYECKSIIIATGVKKRQLGIENDYIGKGVSYCATCDGNFYKNKAVAVIGGGNTALEDANYLSDICNKVYVIIRSSSFRGDHVLVETLIKKDNVEIIYNSNVVELKGNTNLESVVLDNGKTIDISGLFIAVGQIPDNHCFSNIIDVDDKGYIISGEDCKTNVDGIFVAGDCRTKKLRQLVTAASDGAIAAVNVIEYIRKEKEYDNFK